MQNTTTPGAAPPARKRRRECCTDGPCDTGLRNQYFEGKRLTADAFRVEQRYTLERRRLLNRALHGWGVVYGYAVQPGTRDGNAQDRWTSLRIGPGLALDACGRELLRVEANPVEVADLILFDAGGKRIERPPEDSYAPRNPGKEDAGRARACWLLSVHYAEELVGPVRLSDPCHCERKEWEQVCETVRFSLRRIDCADCCAPLGCALECGCGTGPCCGARADGVHPGTQAAQASGNPVDRGGCGCLCEYLGGLSDAGCGELREVEDPCAQLRVDLDGGVPLACVGLRAGACEGEWAFDGPFDACGPRRLVKSNELLFDLLRGCDLTRISAIGWADWHRSPELVDWADFEASFGVLDPADLTRMNTSRDRDETFPVPTQRYWVEFSRPVLADTVRADCFSMTMLKQEDEGGWSGSYHVPILAVDGSAAPGTPAGLVTRAALVVAGRWLYDAVKGTQTIFAADAIMVEIAIRGDFILDCNGQAVDANARGLLPAPSGNGTPGGTFHSRFQVQPRFRTPTLSQGGADGGAGATS